MTKRNYKGPERRKSERFDYATPLNYKVCKKTTVSKILKGYTSNVSELGVLCNIKDKVKINDIIWLSFDRGTLNIYEDLEKRALIYQNGVVAKVARVEPKGNGTFDVGLHFITREEKNISYIFPKVHFLKDLPENLTAEEEETEENELAAEEEKEEFSQVIESGDKELDENDET